MPKKNLTRQDKGTELHEKYEKLKREYEELQLQFQGTKQDWDLQREILKNKEQLVEDLHAERVRLKTLIENAPVGIVMVDEKGDFLVTNREADIILGGKVTGNAYSPNGGYSLHYPDGSLIPPEDLPVVRALDKGEIIKDYEMVVRGEDGQVKYLLVNAAPVKNSRPNAYGSIAVLKDISARKKAEEEREQLLFENRRQREFLENLIREVPVAIAVLKGPEHRYVLENPMQKHLTRGKGEIIGRTVAEVWPEAADEVIPNLDRVYQTGEAFQARSIPFHMVRDKGPEIPYFNVSYTPLEDEKGQVEGILALAVETTEEVLAHKQIENERARLEAVLQSLPVGVWIADQNGQLIGKNEQADRIWAGKAPLSETIEKYQQYTAWDPESGKTLQAEEYPVAKALLTGQQVEPVELYIRRFDETEGTVLVSAAPIRNKEGMLQGVVGVNLDITERKQTEQALRESEQRYRRVVENANEGIWTLDEDNKTDFINKRGAQILGYTPEEMLGRPAIDFVFPEDGPASQRRLEARKKGLAEQSYVRVKHKEGHEVWVRSASTPIYGEQSEYRGALAIFEDITVQKEAEQALRESEERFRQLADAMPQLVWTARADGVLDYCNHRYTEYTGILLKVDNTLDWLDAVHPDDLQVTLEAWQKAVERGEDYQFEHRLRMKNGAYRWHLSRGIQVCSKSGQVLKWYGTSTDIHIQKDVEENLRLSERRLRRLVDANIIAIMYRTEDGKVLEANDAYLELIGYSRLELENGSINCFNLTPKEYHSIDIQAILETRTSGSCAPYEKVFIRKDGSRVPVLIGFAQLDPSEQAQVAFVLNLSRLKQVEAELQEQAQMLEQSNKELENFAYIASHDLQEPLHKITAFGNRLVEKIPAELDEDGKEFLRRMIDASRRMQEMIDALLILSRVNTHGDDFITVDLAEVASTVISDLESRIRSARGEVSFDRLPTIQADPVQMHQLLQNLIGNALKYHKPEAAPRVHISAEPGQKNGDSGTDTVRILVSDNGIGFDEQYLERIFQPFQRLVGHSEFEGSGIGLAICKKIVERHNGTITARSKPGQGSTFIVTLPNGI